MRTWLKEIRLEKKLTMRQVSDAVQISECYYSQIESGKRNVSVSVAKRIAFYLKFNWMNFFS